MHHYPHHIGDYRTHTAHLTMVEDGAYRRLLDLYYMHERSLPADIAAVQRLASARTDDERAAVETVLREFFRLQDDGWHQVRADEEIDAYQARADKARENGANGGRPRKNKPSVNPAETDPVISGFPKHNPDGTQSEPSGKLTVNREPITIKGAKAPSARRSSDDERIKLPTDWQPSVDDRNHASDKSLDPETVTAAFIDYFCEGRGRNEKRTLDGWSKRFRIWCNTDADRKPIARGGPSFRPSVDGGDVGAFARAAARLGGDKLV